MVCVQRVVFKNTPSIPINAEFLLFLFKENNLATITIKCYHSALMNLMSAQGINISHNNDLNSSMRSFHIERPKTLKS